MERHLSDWFWYTGIALNGILAGRLLVLGLVRRYTTLFAYLSFCAVSDCVLVWLWHGSRSLRGFYGPVYFGTQIVTWSLYFLLIIELYSLALAEFTGIRRLGRLILFSALAAVSAAFSILMLVERPGRPERYPLIAFVNLQQRSVFLSLSTVTVVLLVFVIYFQISITRNVRIVYAGFGGYFLANSLMFTLRRYFGESLAPARNLIGSFAYLVALMGIAVFFSKAGETESKPIRIYAGRNGRELENALALQLQNFNQVLVKALKQ
jgi:drug/metabolite transporter superfamily protein YnfA